MGKTKSAQPVKATKTSKDTQVKSISSVKEGAVTKPSQTPKAKSKEMAKQVAMKADKKSQKGKKEPTPVSSSGSESASSASSDDESEEEAPAPTQAAKTNGVKANGVAKAAAKVDAESSDSSESSASDDEAKPAAKAGAVAKDDSDSEDEGTSEGTSEGSSEEESDEEDEAPKVPSPVNAKALKGKLENVASKEASSDEESGSDASSATSESSEEEDSEEEEAPAPKKRKAESDATPAAKKAKTDVDLNDESKKNLFIGHLSYNVDEEWLTREFEKFGELTRVKVMTDRESGQSRGFGYVEFANTADAVKAHGGMQDVEIDGRAINVDYSKPKDAATPRQDRQKSFGDSLSAPSDTLFVANLPFDVTEDIVGEEFGKHASVLGVRLPTDMNTGAPKGFGYVQFDSVEECKGAFEKMTGATIMGRPIRLDYSTPRPPRNNDSPGGRGRGGGRGGFDRGRGGRGGASTNRGGVGEFKGQKMRLE
ncbi:hypothetical protein JMJ35_006682 [Cladonia borealis]|uniref:RRM domain-containing protein n=1 Tax=Cladonia borealis TaxID=184061 RepID=A0AA39QZT9_9LECA|nr:hypothetical protein JMJ35_006682 [Cladonia borealis]